MCPARWTKTYAAEVPMFRCLLFLSTLLLAILTIAAGPVPDRLKLRGDAWQATLERGSFSFSESEANALFSLSQFRGKCQIEMIYDPAQWPRLTFKFMQDDKELLTIEGHTKSAFVAEHNVLYFAHFPTASSGCVVTAHDLATGQELWETVLNAVGTPTHSTYSNEVTIGLGRFLGTEERSEGVVMVTGRESFGDYEEILDQKTGKILAHKVYR
jgi:hypothetical protein